MVSVILALVVCLGLALVVLALVALPARRQGRDVLSARGELVVESLRERTERTRSPRRGHGEGAPAPAAGTGAAPGAEDSLDVTVTARA